MAKKRTSSQRNPAERPPRTSSSAVAKADWTRPDVWRLLLASFVAALGYALLPDPRLVGFALLNTAAPAMTVFRCLVAGCIAGLLVIRPNPRWAASAVTAGGIVIGTAVIALVTPASFDATSTIVGLALGCGAAFLLSWLMSANLAVVAEVLALVVVIIVLLWCAGALPGAMRTSGLFQARQAALSAAPQPQRYAFDGLVFLRTYYLMKGGEGYYEAFKQAIGEEYHGPQLTSPFNYREPFVFYLWWMFPGDSGVALFDWFVVYAVLVLVCSYVLASSLVARGVALLAPTAMVAWFFYFFWSANWFLVTEVWAAGFAVAAVMCLVRRWRVPSLVLLTTAVAAREFMVLLIPAWLLVWWFSSNHKKGWWFAASSVLGPGLVLGTHFLAVPATSGGAGSAGAWLHGGFFRLLSTVSFGFSVMPAGQWISLVIAAAAIASAALARPRWRTSALLAATILPTLFLLAISMGVGGYYWGAFYAPLAVSIAPGVLGRLLPAETSPSLIAMRSSSSSSSVSS